MIKFIIPGEPVVKKNNRPIFKYGNRPFIGKSDKLHNAELGLKIFFMTNFKGPQLTGNLGIIFKAYLGTNRRKDLSNCWEIYGDAMQSAGVIKDDSQIKMIMMTKDYDKENPRVEIEVKEV